MSCILANLTASTRDRVFLAEDLERLAGMGELVWFDPGKDQPAAFQALLAGADAMITCWGSRPLTAADLAGRTRPLLVAHAAGSIRHLVPKELLSQGVRLTHSPAGVAPAVAEFAVALMIMALRQTVARAAAFKAGEGFSGPCQDLAGLTVGLVGLSQVGRRVPLLLAPFGCRVLAYDPYCKAADAAKLGAELVEDLDELIVRSHVLSLHAPVTPETEGMIDARRVALMKPGCAFVNTARGALVDHDALFARALAGEIQAYLDVTTPEPLPRDHPAWNSPNIFLTPHIAGPTAQTLRRIVTHALDEIGRFLAGRPLLTEVTPERYDLLA